MKETKFDDFLQEQLKDPTIAAEYKRLGPTYEIIGQMIDLRYEQEMTQKELAARAGTKQSSISRMESGNYNPTLSFLQKIATAFGKELKVEFH